MFCGSLTVDSVKSTVNLEGGKLHVSTWVITADAELFLKRAWTS
jgi:hypothetical protein